MILSVCNDCFDWSLDFGPDSLTLIVNDLFQEMTLHSRDLLLAAWSWFMFQRQELLNNHLARVPITPNQKGTMEIRDEVLSSVGAQDTDTSGYQVSDPEDFEFHWEGPDLNMDAVHRPSMETLSCPLTFNDLRWVQWLKTQFWLTKSKTRRFLFLFQ